ncbi:sigma-70 family RNA polymerase sigma factor [Lentzea sp. BCCO 10_0856]|uniref:Sigma-70 family RNA polymerase sigma factor n=1 Tax=Lentzea miocenica TaxID=3095431 RepID=A0ABU4TC01_9PSEU|nr:sigma-70 family RNA polymerase sigma factor [Lentzea sp. BCCO 10_0856]MDX8035423.1 sigma-70 family RNA polymerase sigma factor [Lentzea sp. BCCO 10_0856]
MANIGTRRRPDLRGNVAVQEIYALYAPELYRFALRQLGDDCAAEEVVQEVFLRMWRSADGFRPELASLRVWLFAIARNVVIDEVRARLRQDKRLDAARTAAAAGGGENSSDFADTTLNRRVVEVALLRISAEHRAALVETYLRGRSYRDVAAELRVPQATLRSRVFLGLKAMRLAMDQMGVQP